MNAILPSLRSPSPSATGPEASGPTAALHTRLHPLQQPTRLWQRKHVLCAHLDPSTAWTFLWQCPLRRTLLASGLLPSEAILKCLDPPSTDPPSGVYPRMLVPVPPTMIPSYPMPDYGEGMPSVHYTSLGDLRGPRSSGGRSKRSQRSSQKSMTRSNSKKPFVELLKI